MAPVFFEFFRNVMKIYSHFVGTSNNIKLIYKISFIIVVFSYFLFHAINGENGLISYVKIKQQVIEKAETLKNLQSNLIGLQKRVDLLSNKTLDLDILEERSRIVLNYCYPEEIVVREKNIIAN